MSSAYTTNLPNYTDPSAADDISSLISTALAVQEGLFDAREGFRRVNAARVNELLPRLVDTDERYLRLLNESRTSATELYVAIQNFTDVAIPIAQDARNPMEERVAIVKDFADKIAASAQKDLQSYDKQVEVLKDNLSELVADLTAIEVTLRNQSNEQSLSPAAKYTANESSLTHQRHLDSIVIVKFLASVVGWFVAPNNDRRKAPVTRPSVNPTPTSSPVDEAILKDISALVVLFSGLVGKLGHFGVVWEKLVADSAELSAYLSHGAGDQDVIGNRVQAEVGVYEKIKHALDDYCLRTK